MTDPKPVSTPEKRGKPPGSTRKRAGLIGTIVGVAAAGVAAGVAVERLVLRRSRAAGGDIHAEEPFGRLPYDETLTVTTADGIDLHVEIVEPVDGIAVGLDRPVGKPEPHLVFVHGFCLDQGTFHFQRQALDRVGDYRMVFYDQPGHGLSGTLHEGEYELPALGEATVPTGSPIVLIGHSMGGMALMAFAELHPELFAERVIGVVLIATSGGQLDGSRYYGVPEIINRSSGTLLTIANTAVKVTGPTIDKARKASTDLAWLLTRRYGFGGDKPSAALVSYVEKMNSSTTTETVTRYLRTINSHARYPALMALAQMPVLVVAGEKDMITPLAHAEEIARLLPHARLVIVPDSGHVVLLEHPEVVNEALLEFLSQIGADEVGADEVGKKRKRR